MNHKKLNRLYHEEKLMVRRRGGRKRALGTRAPMLLPERINQRWSLDFIAGTLTQPLIDVGKLLLVTTHPGSIDV